MRRYTLNKYMISRLMAVLLCLAVLGGATPGALATEVTAPPETMPAAGSAASGSCGENLTWTFQGGTLTITGSGDMEDYSEITGAPWYAFRREIYALELPEGLTSVGDMAFYECNQLRVVLIPDSVTRIGDFAFAYCADLAMLSLSGTLTAIGECAFTDCYDLPSLQLPESLRSLGKKAFYRCEALTAVVIPSGVTEIGVSAFGYCKSLVSADIKARIRELPTLMFYGCKALSSVKLPDTVDTLGYHSFLDCETLSTVYYNGTSQTPEEIQEAIGKDLPDFTDYGDVTQGSTGDSASSTTAEQKQDGTTVITSTEVTQGEDATVSSQTHYVPDTGSTSTEITVTITGQNGWKEAGEAVDGALNKNEEFVRNTGSAATTPEITVYVKGDGAVDQAFIDNLAGRNVIIVIITQDGSIWRIDAAGIKAGSGAYDLRCQVAAGDADLCAELETETSFRLNFRSSAQINAQVMVRIGTQYALQNATLFQRQGSELIRRQTTVVDREGYAHFYLASVDDKSEYYIAMNLPDAQQEAIVPQELNAAYGAPVNYQPIQYEITGRTSSWGMNINQVTWIMVGFLAVTVITVGFVMFFLNKRRLAMGYVPEWDDEDEE